MSWWWVAGGVAAVALSTWVITSWLLSIAGTEPGRKIEAIKTGFTVGAGVGGTFALLLATRRQWLQERIHVHDREIDAANQHDAIERRVTELYSKAADQIGNEKPAVRLAGLYSMERLAQNHRQYRQTIVNVFCAYLRMAFPERANPAEVHAWEEEKQVRLAAQDILARHLRYPSNEKDQADFWPKVFLKLNGAHLIDFRLDSARVSTADFTGATFNGDAQFTGTCFRGPALFRNATFNGKVTFADVSFRSIASFIEAKFHKYAAFRKAAFSNRATFAKAAFMADATFTESSFDKGGRFFLATFHKMAKFNRITSLGASNFEGAKFEELALFNASKFSHDVTFCEARFFSGVKFRAATFVGEVNFLRVHFGSRAVFQGSVFSSSAVFGGSTFEGASNFNATSFGKGASFPGVKFCLGANFGVAYFGDMASFAGAKFYARAGFDRCTFYAKATFRSVQFHGLIRFTGPSQDSEVDFTEASAIDISPVECALPVGWQLSGSGSQQVFVHRGSS
jgi:uncharacterized protein YjbI with pentapeptide repeats